MNDKLNTMNETMTILDKQLDSINATLSISNLIRGLIKQGQDIKYIDEYLETTIKVGINTKESILGNIEKLHKEIAVHHIKRTEGWKHLPEELKSWSEK